MRKMKDSQIEWVGNIPETWTTELGKHFMSCLDRPVKDDDSVITCFRDGQVTLRSNRREDGFTLAFQEIGYQGIEPGDLVVHGMDGFAGAIGISDSRGKATPVLNVLDTKQNKKYMMYALRNMAYTDVFLALSTGIRIRSCDTSWKKLRALNYALPPLDEQNKIADYLEVKEKQIEDLISKVEAQIVKSKQYKQSVITEVIVNGLDPNSPMKDSGLDWLGQIPKDTDVIGITYILDKNHPYPLGDGDHGLIGPDDYISEGIPYIRVQNLGWGTDLLTDNIVYISEERNNAIKNSTLRPNDILFAKTGASGRSVTTAAGRFASICGTQLPARAKNGTVPQYPNTPLRSLSFTTGSPTEPKLWKTNTESAFSSAQIYPRSLRITAPGSLKRLP